METLKLDQNRKKEYRAVFASPFGHDGSKGSTRNTLEEALQDRPLRSEETFEYLAHVEEREVSEWRPVGLRTVVDCAIQHDARSHQR